MAIKITCPNGHLLKVKDKYAGKKGLCPLCADPVIVEVPEQFTEKEIVELLGPPPAEDPIDESASVFDESTESESVFDQGPGEGSAMSLAGASAVKQMVRCPTCSQQIPFWSTQCPHCNSVLRSKKGH